MSKSSKKSSVTDYWEESRCSQCDKRIRRGEPRFIITFIELGVGPGYPGYSKEALEEDRENNEASDGYGRNLGLVGINGTLALCGPCSGDSPEIAIMNPWFLEREERASVDGGPSVHTIPLSQLNISSGDIADEHMDQSASDEPIKGTVNAIRSEVEDRFLSTHAGPIKAKPTQDDQRERMAGFLNTPASSKMPPMMRKICSLWASGKKQLEIEKETGIDQTKISRMIRAGNNLIYSQRR